MARRKRTRNSIKKSRKTKVLTVENLETRRLLVVEMGFGSDQCGEDNHASDGSVSQEVSPSACKRPEAVEPEGTPVGARGGGSGGRKGLGSSYGRKKSTDLLQIPGLEESLVFKDRNTTARVDLSNGFGAEFRPGPLVTLPIERPDGIQSARITFRSTDPNGPQYSQLPKIINFTDVAVGESFYVSDYIGLSNTYLNSSGNHEFEFSIEFFEGPDATGNSYSQNFDDEYSFHDLNNSEFGAGWSLAGLELVLEQNGGANHIQG